MFLFLLYFALFSSAVIANKIALAYLPPAMFVAARMLGAGILLLAYYWRRSHRISWRYFKHDIPILLCISLLTTLIPSIFKAYALKHMIAAKYSLLGSIDPFVTALYAYLLFSEKLTFQKICGMFLGFISLIVMLLATSPDEQNLLVFNTLSYPELAALAALMLGRIGWMLVQKLVRAERYTPGELNGLTMFASGMAALAISYPTESMTLLTGHQWGVMIAALLYTIVVGNVIALTMYAYFLKKYSSTFVSLAGFSINFYVAFYGWILLHEIPPLQFFIAAALMLLSLVIFYSPSWARMPPADNSCR
jgi:drug/metabolite transporter (DMT)-like permease